MELIISIIVLGIISGIVLINWSYTSTNLDAQASLLASNLRYTQNLSTAKNERYRLVINTANKTYEIQNSHNIVESLPNGNANQKLPNKITFDTITNITNKIIFDGKGVPYTDLTTPESPLLDNAVITLKTNKGRTRTVTISPETGKISI